MKRTSGVLAVGAALAAFLAGCAMGASADPTLEIGDSVAGDFAAVATETYATFVAAAGGTHDCVGGLRLEAVYELDELALYDQDTAILHVRVPAPEPSLQASLVHEFAHHVEVACSSHLEMREAFLEAQGLDPATAWFGGEEWNDIPSEQFAEAVVQVVLGVRMRHRLSLQLEPETVDLVEEWLVGH